MLDKPSEDWQQKSGRVISELLETELPELKSEDIMILVWGLLGLPKVRLIGVFDGDEV